jgi:cyclophilin family peptidyl-prolyl cis-trans isomerase
MKKKLLWLLAVACLAPSPSACARETAPSAAPAPAAPAVEAPIHLLRDTSRLEPRFAGAIEPGVEYRAAIELKKGGLIEISLFAETAPNHVANFVSLARKGFYDGVTFHRVLEGFMAQGGDPTGTGAGGPGYTIKAEFSNLPHVRGTLSMARTSDPNSAGSQFFLCFKPTPFLDGQYTVFGQVVTGMELVDGLRRRDPGTNPNFPGDAIKTVTIREIRSAAAPATGEGAGSDSN